jgi:hypothetical protein
MDLLRGLRAVMRLPTVQICLMASKTEQNDPFFSRMVHNFYRSATKRHPRFPLIRNLQYGVALFAIPDNAEDYVNRMVESSARRNVKKARRVGYTVDRIDYNARRLEIADIIRSAPIRQGPMPTDLMDQDLPVISDPPSRTPYHDYVYLGVTLEGVLAAYCACMVAGELFLITDIYGHHAHQPNGVVPLLLTEAVAYARRHHPQARFCSYDKYFGASASLRRFKKKFAFLPYKVVWTLDRKA